MKRVPRILRLPVLALLALVAGWVVVSALPVRLDPDAAAAMQRLQPSVPESDNAYFTLVGLTAPAGTSPSVAGLARVQDFNARAQNGIAAPDDDLIKSLPNGPARPTREVSDLCKWQVEDCLPKFSAKAELIRTEETRCAELLARYRAAWTYPSYADMSAASSASVSEEMKDVEHLMAAMIGTRLAQGRTSEALELLSGHAAFHRKVLEGEASLVTKLLSAGWLARDARLIGEWGARFPHRAKAERGRLLVVLEPLTPAQLSLRPSILREFQIIALTARALGRAGEPLFVNKDSPFAWIDRPLAAVLFSENDAINRSYARTRRWLELDSTPAVHVRDAVARAAADQEAEARTGEWWWLAPRPISRAYAAVVSPDFGRYIVRMHDTQGKLAAARAQLQAIAAGVPVERMAQFLASLPPVDRNPYTGAPLEYDPERGIVFSPHAQTLSSEEIKSFVVPYLPNANRS